VYIEAWHIPMLTETPDLSDLMHMNGQSEGEFELQFLQKINLNTCLIQFG
jgi:hypothetical protein